MIQSVFKSSGQAIPTQRLRRQWDSSLSRLKEKKSQETDRGKFSGVSDFFSAGDVVSALTAEPVLKSAFLRGLWVRHCRLIRQAEDARNTEKLAQEGRARARRNLQEERYRMFRRIYWEWAASVYRNYPALKKGWERSDYEARRAYAWPMMHSIEREVGALPC